MSKLERVVIAFLLMIGLLTFFFPLLTMSVPIIGQQSVSGYDVLSKFGDFSKNLNSGQPEASPATAPGDATGSSPEADQEMPLSVRLAWLVPLLIFASFACAAVSLAAVFIDGKAVKFSSAIGACLGIIAILHLAIMNSDLRSWITESMGTIQGGSDNPFAGFAQGLGAMLANSIGIGAGAGLYVLAATLLLVAALSFTRILSRVRIAES